MSATELGKIGKVVITAELVLDSPLHIGAGGDSNRGAEPVVRDRSGYPVLPGSSLAGVFFEHAARLVKAKTDNAGAAALFKRLTGRDRSLVAEDEFTASILKFRSAPLVDKILFDAPPVHVRDGVRIDDKTRTAEDGGKHSLEVVPPGLRFAFTLEAELGGVDERDSDELFDILYAVVWRDFGERRLGTLGKGAARGTGWFHLEHLESAAVDSSDSLRTYLDADDAREWVEKEVRFSVLGKDKGKSTLPDADVAVFDVMVSVLPDWPVLVRESPELGYLDESQADQVFVRIPQWSKNSSRWAVKLKPVIPGGSLRGALRAFVERLDGSRASSDAKTLRQLFPGDGKDENASRLLVKDAALEVEEIKVKVVERLALDEFTRGVFGSGKFSEEPMFFEGTFKGRMIIESPKEGEKEALVKLVNSWGARDCGLIPIGAHGAPAEWKIEEVSHGQ